MEFHSLQIPPPKNWQDFEALCLDIFRRVWGDPTAQRNGRLGQPQAGTDVYGRRNEKWQGVQCKGNDLLLGAEVTETELRDEVCKALSFKPPLAHWVLATTAPKDAAIEKTAREISDDHRAHGLFTVQVMGWEDLVSLMDDQVVAKHYPTLAPSTQAIKISLEGIADGQNETNQLLKQSQQVLGQLLGLVSGGACQLPVGDPGAGVPIDPADITLQAKIDSARDLLRSGHPRTALGMFKGLAVANWENASTRAKFRLLTNQGAAEYNLGNLSEAAELFLKAEPFGNGDPLSHSNVVLALILRDELQEARRRADAILKENPSNPFVAPLRVLAAFDEEDVDDPFSVLPATHTDNV